MDDIIKQQLENIVKKLHDTDTHIAVLTSELKNNCEQTDKLYKVLVSGNGNKPITTRVAICENDLSTFGSRIKDVETFCTTHERECKASRRQFKSAIIVAVISGISNILMGSITAALVYNSYGHP